LTGGSWTIYGNHMQKTTVYLDEATYRRLKQIARRGGRTPAEMVREAVAEYTVRHAPRRRPRSVGAFASRRSDLGRRAESLLAGFGTNR
jgi:metal-responsive CopG/Arc/MetJ family transcriptional regulator